MASDIATEAQVEAPGRFQFQWVPAVLLRPRRAFAQILGQNRAVWLTPMLILTLTTLVRILVAGSLKQAAAAAGGAQLPPDFQYYSPEQQAQFMQAAQSTSSPVFVYILPAVIGLLGVWVGWLLVGGLLHLALTLLGGRGDTGAAMNLVAWAGLPFAIRDLVRVAAMLITRSSIQSPGLSGFAPAGGSNTGLFLTALLALVDLYVIWHVILLILGVQAGNGLPRGKAVGGVLVSISLVLIVQALVGFGATQLGGLTIVRPFF